MRLGLPVIFLGSLIGLAGCKTVEQPPANQTARLSDGTEVTLETVTYGKQHQRKFLNTTYNYRFDREALIFWATMRGGSPDGAYSFTDQVAFDEHGCQISLGRASLRKAESVETPAVAIFKLDVFPRRGQTVGLRLYGESANEPIVEFTAVNPVPGPHPEWAAESVPITEQDGDLSVALTGLEVTKASARGQKPIVRTSFRIAQNEQPTGDWEPVQLLIADATGNEIPWEFRRSLNRNSLLADGTTAVTTVGSLCLEESAWKLRAEFSPIATADVASEGSWTVNNVPIPKSEQVIRMTKTTKQNDRTLALIGVAGPGVVQWTPNSSRSHPDTEVRVGLSLPSDGLRLMLRATDDRGNEIGGYTQGYTDDPGENMRIYSFFLKAPSEARNLNLQFIVHKSRVFEFLAKPRAESVP